MSKRNNPWIDALKVWNKDKPSWCLPRKGSAEYDEVKRIMETKKSLKTPIAKKAPAPKKIMIKKKKAPAPKKAPPPPKKAPPPQASTDLSKFKKAKVEDGNMDMSWLINKLPKNYKTAKDPENYVDKVKLNYYDVGSYNEGDGYYVVFSPAIITKGSKNKKTYKLDFKVFKVAKRLPKGIDDGSVAIYVDMFWNVFSWNKNGEDILIGRIDEDKKFDKDSAWAFYDSDEYGVRAVLDEDIERIVTITGKAKAVRDLLSKPLRVKDHFTYQEDIKIDGKEYKLYKIANVDYANLFTKNGEMLTEYQLDGESYEVDDDEPSDIYIHDLDIDYFL